MWFNVFLVIFLFISFMIAFSAIGNCLIRLKALGTCLDNVNEVQTKMYKVLEITAEYEAKQMLVLDDMAHGLMGMKQYAKRASVESNLTEHIQSIYDELLKISEDIEQNRSEIIKHICVKLDGVLLKPTVTTDPPKTNTAVGDPTMSLAGLTEPIITGGTTSAPVVPEIPPAKKSSSKTARKSAVKSKK